MSVYRKVCAAFEGSCTGKGRFVMDVHFGGREEARNARCPFTAFALYYDGKFITHEIQSVSKFEKIMDEVMG